MFKKIISFTLILTLVLGSFSVAFAAEVEPQSNMVTYYTMSPLVSNASDYTTLDSVRNENLAYEGALISLWAAGVTLLITKNPKISKFVKAAIDAGSIGVGVYNAYKAYNADYASGLFYTVRIYKYKSNGPNTYAFQYKTSFYGDSARTKLVYSTTEYYTYVI